MKQCPDCNMMLEDNVERCPACLYIFDADEVGLQETANNSEEQTFFGQADMINNVEQPVNEDMQMKANEVTDDNQKVQCPVFEQPETEPETEVQWPVFETATQEAQQPIFEVTKDTQEAYETSQPEPMQSSYEASQTNTSSTCSDEFKCVKCGKPLSAGATVCECGGHAMSTISPEKHRKLEGVGPLGWFLAIVFAPITWIVSVIIYNSKKASGKNYKDYEKSKYMSDISFMCTMVYVLFIGFYLVTQQISSPLLEIGETLQDWVEEFLENVVE